MSPATFASQTTRWASYLVPLATTFIVTLVAVLPLPIPYYAITAPSLTLIAVFYWMVFRPDLMPTVGLFAIGIVNDALSGAPLGLSSLIYLITYMVILSQRRFIVGQSFLILWCAFGLLAPAVLLLNWVVLSLMREAVLSPLAALSGIALTVLAFPLLAWPLVRVQRILLGNETMAG